ncbi:hypothetical protein E2C01_061012 [Portunus trituberculatus]|uniref:Uncharacterized protein n=1 Tax=Portunus trituberculatus TaxID=210409 RepID=A0A5B7HC23_PORTR|nr:hypothetical protein [Portunus trituberculatus]
MMGERDGRCMGATESNQMMVCQEDSCSFGDPGVLLRGWDRERRDYTAATATTTITVITTIITTTYNYINMHLITINIIISIIIINNNNNKNNNNNNSNTIFNHNTLKKIIRAVTNICNRTVTSNKCHHLHLYYFSPLENTSTTTGPLLP